MRTGPHTSPKAILELDRGTIVVGGLTEALSTAALIPLKGPDIPDMSGTKKLIDPLRGSKAEQ